MGDFMSNLYEKVSNMVVEAGSTFSKEKILTIQGIIENEKNELSKEIFKLNLENAKKAEGLKFNLCDDSGIPHLLLEVGSGYTMTSENFNDIYRGVADGLRKLPARPMAVIGTDIERVEQSKGLSADPGDVVPPAIFIKPSSDDKTRLHLLLQGGGPEIRGVTSSVFHQRSIDVVFDQILDWAKEKVKLLGCTPVIPAIGIGRTHYEATTLMLEAMIKGNPMMQTELESNFTRKLNETNTGPLGLGGTTALATYINIGPQRASGVRIVSLRLCCSVEPRVSTIEL